MAKTLKTPAAAPAKPARKAPTLKAPRGAKGAAGGKLSPITPKAKAVVKRAKATLRAIPAERGANVGPLPPVGTVFAGRDKPYKGITLEVVGHTYDKRCRVRNGTDTPPYRIAVSTLAAHYLKIASPGKGASKTSAKAPRRPAKG